MVSLFDHEAMNREKLYREPDIINIIYDDVINALYSFNGKKPVSHRIKILKFNAACDYLIESNLEIDEIALKLDLDNTVIFNNFFKEFSGVTPEVFRKRYSL